MTSLDREVFLMGRTVILNEVKNPKIMKNE